MTNYYTPEKKAEILFTFAKLYENFQTATAQLRKYGFQYILPIELCGKMQGKINEDMKKLILDTLAATDNNGCREGFILQTMVSTFEEYIPLICEEPNIEETVNKSLTCFDSIFEKLETEVSQEKVKIRKLPVFIGCEILSTCIETVYDMLSAQLLCIKTNFPDKENTSWDIDEILKAINDRTIISSQDNWKTAISWNITSYFIGKKSSMPDSEYIKNFIEGIEIDVANEILVYVPNKLVMTVASCPNLRMHSSIKIPHIIWLLRDGNALLGKQICQQLFESYLGLGNLYLTNFFKDIKNPYCQSHNVTIAGKMYSCYVIKITPAVYVKAETKFFYSS